MLGDPIAWLEESGAQRDVIDGLRSRLCGGDWPTLWRSCPRGDWQLGIAVRLGVDQVALVRAAIGCARTCIDRYDGREAVVVLDVASRWALGTASADEVTAATKALELAASTLQDPAADAAARSAQAVGMGVSDPAVLTSAAAFAAEATIVATAECGLELAMGWAHGACAEAVRAAIPWEIVEPRIAAWAQAPKPCP